MEKKVCSKCGTEKPASEFGKRWCKTCTAEYNKKYYETNKGHIKQNVAAYAKANPGKRNKTTARKSAILRKFGVTADEYDQMLSAQGGVCAICGYSSDLSYGLFVDHDHATGEVRGLLCRGCNTGLGFAADDISILQKAIEYLGKH